MMCGGSKTTSVSAKTEEFYKAGKKDYGDLPSLAMGDKVERTEDGMADIPKKKKKDVNKSVANAARSLLMPYAK
jgi:hypothetical protein